MSTSEIRRAAARRQSVRPLSTNDSPDADASACLVDASTRTAHRKRRGIATAARAVRAAVVLVTGWTWQAVVHGPLGSVLSILLALGIGGVVLHGVIAGESTAHTGEPPESQLREIVQPKESATAVAAPIPNTVPSASEPSSVADNDEYVRWLFASPVIYLVGSQAEADLLRIQLAEIDDRRAEMGAGPRNDMIVVAGSEEEAARAAVLFLHQDAIRAALGLPSLPVIDLRSP